MGAKEETHSTMTYNDRAITYTGDLASYDYDSILRDKQGNISSLFQLADYYVDADPIFRGIINGVYTPFALSGEFRLVGANEQVKTKYSGLLRPHPPEGPDAVDLLPVFQVCQRLLLPHGGWATSSRCRCI